ncbi:MAG TPA: hypothetical protein VK445_05880 [Dissulfurispiraceae bacterium]|nr:hypothetical protein [Dissulfurispiraceae bacterium]
MSLSAAFLDAVSPEHAVISAGLNNPYGHPHPITVSVLSAADIRRTDADGAVGVRISGGRIAMKTWNDRRVVPMHAPSDELHNIKCLISVW